MFPASFGGKRVNHCVSVRFSVCFWYFLQAIGVDWRQKLDSQRGAVLATELRNNSCKLAKWTVSSILAGSEYLKLG